MRISRKQEHTLKVAGPMVDILAMLVFSCYAIAALALAIAGIEYRRNN